MRLANTHSANNCPPKKLWGFVLSAMVCRSGADDLEPSD